MVAKFDYSKAQAKAKALIEKFGDAGSFVVTGSAAGVNEDGDVVTATPDVTYSGTVTPLLRYEATEIDGSTIKVGDAYVFFDGAEIPLGAVITLNGVVMRVVDVKGITSVSGVRVYRKIQLRR